MSALLTLAFVTQACFSMFYLFFLTHFRGQHVSYSCVECGKQERFSHLDFIDHLLDNDKDKETEKGLPLLTFLESGSKHSSFSWSIWDRGTMCLMYIACSNQLFHQLSSAHLCCGGESQISYTLLPSKFTLLRSM